MMYSSVNVYSDVFSCRLCSEFSEYHKFAPGCQGGGGLGLMIVGESAHKPSIDAGRYYANGSVRSLLEGIVDLERDCYLSDAIKCDKQYSSAKGKTLDGIAKTCSSRFLSQEISLLQPKSILAVGRIAFKILTGFTGGFSSRQNDGNVYLETTSRIPVHPVIHPSYAAVHYGHVPWQSLPYDQCFVQIVQNCLL